MKNSAGDSVERGTNGLEGFVREVLFLAPKDQVRFASMWVRGVREDRSLLLKIYFVVAKGVHPATGLESWMESRLKKNVSLTPRRLAYECRYYKRARRGDDSLFTPFGTQGEGQGSEKKTEACLRRAGLIQLRFCKKILPVSLRYDWGWLDQRHKQILSH